MDDHRVRDDELDELVPRGDETLAAFVDRVRSAFSGPQHRVDPELAAVFAHGFGDGAEAAHATAPAVAPSPTWRRLDDAFGLRKLRAALAAGAAFMGFCGVGAADLLPGPLQGAFDDAIGTVGIERPHSTSVDGDDSAGRPGSGVEPGSSGAVTRAESPDGGSGATGGAGAVQSGAPSGRSGTGTGAAPSQPGQPSSGIGVPSLGSTPQPYACVPREHPGATSTTTTVVPPSLPSPDGVPAAGVPEPPPCPSGTTPVPMPAPLTPPVPTVPGTGGLTSIAPASPVP